MRGTWLVRMAVAVALMILFAPALSHAAWAHGDDPKKDLFVLSGTGFVPEEDEIRNLVVLHGDAMVEGTVNGSVVVFDGHVTISGTVSGNVTSFHGNVFILEGSHVGGDVFADRPSVGPGSEVDGRVRSVPEFAWSRSLGLFGGFGVWLGISISVLVLGLLGVWLVPRRMEAAFLAAKARTVPVVLSGIGILLLLLFAGVVVLVTVAALPFGFFLLGGLILMAAIGSATASWILGRFMVGSLRSRALAFVLGWGVLRLAALAPGLGALIVFAGTAFGLGAIAIAMWRPVATFGWTGPEGSLPRPRTLVGD